MTEAIHWVPNSIHFVQFLKLEKMSTHQSFSVLVFAMKKRTKDGAIVSPLLQFLWNWLKNIKTIQNTCKAESYFQ